MRPPFVIDIWFVTLSRIMRFVIPGGGNTLMTWGLYAILLHWLPYHISYMVAYGSGIALAYLLSRYFVFKKNGGSMGPVWVICIYIFQYLLGMSLIGIWVQILHAPAIWAPLFTAVLSFPVVYFFSARVFRERG